MRGSRTPPLDEPGREALLLPVEAGLAHWPAVVVDPDQARRLGMGQGISLDPQAAGTPADPAPGAPLPVNILTPAGRSLGLGELEAGLQLRPRRLFRWASAQ